MTSFGQGKMSGYTRTERNTKGKVIKVMKTNFLTNPWSVTEWDGENNLIDQYCITRPTKERKSERIKS